MSKRAIQITALVVTVVGAVVTFGFFAAAIWTHHALSQSLAGTGMLALFFFGPAAVWLWLWASDKDE